MKQLFITTSLVALVAASSFGQGVLTIKTQTTKNTVFSATDGTTASLAPIPTTGTVGSFGAVSYEMYAAPSGTVLALGGVGALGQNYPNFTGWTAAAMVPSSTPAYTSAGIINAFNYTLPAGTAGQNEELEIVAYTGSLSSPTLYGFVGSTFNGGSVTFASITTSTGALGWSQATGAGSPPTPTAISTGATAFGSIVMTPVPEPSTIALGGLAAAALLAFRRRK